MSILGVKEEKRMIKSCDVGSLPYEGEEGKFLEGAKRFTSETSDDFASFFEETVVRTFLDKLKAGIDIPAFPQFRDMNEMFLSIFEGLEKTPVGYVETGSLHIKQGKGVLPEVAVIEKNAQRISTETGKTFQLRVCVTGPYTLASFLPYRNSQTYKQLGSMLSEIVEKNAFAVKHGKAALVSVDEPLFGVMDDPLIDRGAESRETLLDAWESIMGKAKRRNVETCIHLHCTSNELFWETKSLGIVESHVDDPLYNMKATRERLDKQDKLLKVSIATTDFDRLIKGRPSSCRPEDVVADAWKKISIGTVDPEAYLENVDLMRERLNRAVRQFGVERVALAGTECGLRGFPTYASAIECLKRVSQATI